MKESNPMLKPGIKPGIKPDTKPDKNGADPRQERMSDPVLFGGWVRR